MGINAAHLLTTFVVVSIVVVCAFIQKVFRRELERDQYYYLRDICLIASWALIGIWTQSMPMKLTVTAGVIAGLVGFCQKVVKSWDFRFCYLLIGFGVALLGPRITFIGQPDGEFLYISNVATIMLLSTLWMGFFPILFQELDEIPGMGGFLLLISWSLMVLVTSLTSRGFSDAFVMSISGLALILVFWSRHVNVYRRLGAPLSAMWGTLLAGTSMLGASKGVAFATVIVLPLGLFAIPILETSLSVLSAAFSPKPLGNMLVYRKLVNRGIDHPTAVFLVAAACGICGVAMALLQMSLIDPLSLAVAVVLTALGVYVAFARLEGTDENTSKRPTLWGVAVDNFSLDYALGRVNGWISSGATPQIIVTPDALAALRSRNDRDYARIVQNAGLVLPDGTGLVGALRFLGFSVQERIAGVDFVDHLSRLASGHGWPVYLFGGRPGIAQLAAEKLNGKYPGLTIAGCRSGYFTEDESEAIAQEIAASGARIVFVALGVPKQELWIEGNLQTLENTVCIGVGGSFDVISGTLKRAPERWRALRLEWLYRTIQEPSRWRRVAKLPLFVVLVLMKKIGLDTWRAGCLGR